jgi:hypothetical protein
MLQTGAGAKCSPSRGASLIQLAFQHNHWAAVPLLIQAGAPWPDSFQPPAKTAAYSLKQLEVGE